MNRRCEEIQELLAADGVESLAYHQEAKEHLAECEECFEFLESLKLLDSSLANLPVRAPSADVVEELLRTVAKDRSTSYSRKPKYPRWQMMHLPSHHSLRNIAALAVLILILILPTTTFLGKSATQSFSQIGYSISGGGPSSHAMRQPAFYDAISPSTKELSAPQNQRLNEQKALSASAPMSQTGGDEPQLADKLEVLNNQVNRVSSETDRLSNNNAPRAPKPEAQDSQGKELEARRKTDSSDVGMDDEVLKASLAGYQPSTRLQQDFEAKDAKDGNRDRDHSLESPMNLQGVGIMTMGFLDKNVAAGLTSNQQQADEATVKQLLAQLSYKEASGYWANTYVPGDATYRGLHTALSTSDRTWLERVHGGPLKLHDLASEPSQPIDAPKDSALGLTIVGAHNGLRGEQRMLVQVGLKGSERPAGRRSAMNVGVLLDLRGEIKPDTAAKLREFLLALNEAKDIGDTFRVVVAGKPGGIVIPAADFKYGPITVALDELLNSKSAAAPALDLIGAYQKTIEEVAASDDPNSPLGSSEIIVVTDQSFGGASADLNRLAQKSAVGGIPTSVVSLRYAGDSHEIDQLALSGQGNRRVMQSKDQAKEIVTKELAAASRAVAKAVRLRIRLAPGVKLVDVIGSYRLDAPQAQQVREAEKSIDDRLAKNLGIDADRGKDEDGIQIVIPTFFSGDSHIILLDVVVPGNGPVAEVQARFKDLVGLKNATVSTSFSLNPEKDSAVEDAVLKNYLAQELSHTLGNESVFVANGNFAEAITLAKNYQTLADAVRASRKGLAADSDLKQDAAMLNEYGTLLERGAQLDQSARDYLSKSLAYAGKKKILPAPHED